MNGAGKSLISSFDYVWGRLTARLEGLEDEEYFWEPVKGCWSLRISPDGIWRLDGGGGGGPAPDPVPVTTIAWRLGHFGGLALGGFTERRFPGAATNLVFASHAAEVPEFLAARYAGWRASLAGLDDTEWEAPLGSDWGPYADSSTFDLALHVLDEVVHHAAEVGLLRDLFNNRSGARPTTWAESERGPTGAACRSRP
jgi:hypothetical protein